MERVRDTASFGAWDEDLRAAGSIRSLAIDAHGRIFRNHAREGLSPYNQDQKTPVDSCGDGDRLVGAVALSNHRTDGDGRYLSTYRLHDPIGVAALRPQRE